MNMMIATVGVDPGFAVGGGSAGEAMAVAGFVVIGLVLLFAGGRLLGRHAHAHVPHIARYSSPRL